MPHKVSKAQADWTIEHLCKYGDTDIFPYPFELKFLKDFKDKISDEIAGTDLHQYNQISAIESLVPKNRYGFRVAHQLFPIDLLVFSSLVFEAAQQLEQYRDPAKNSRVFSYRFSPDSEFRLFSADHRFKDWMSRVWALAAFGEDEYSHVIKTDISDFYQRIYRHRIENIVETATGSKEIASLIERFMDSWRGKQSFGIPVGGNAARILAEAALSDIDQAMISEGYDFCRYVDDFVIFVKHEQDPDAAIAFLAGQLFTNEGLGLNNHKTRLFTQKEFFESYEVVNAEDQDAAEEAAVEKLFWAAYDDDGSNPEAFEMLLQQDLRGQLEEEISKDFWDVSHIKVLLRALRLTKNKDIPKYIRENLKQFLPFAKDVVLLIDELGIDGDSTFKDAGDEIVELLLSERLRPLEATRAWLLELFVRNRVDISAAQVRRLDALPGTLDARQLCLIRGAMRDLGYFRQRKARVDELPVWTQPAFIFAAKCLPREEYRFWLNSIKDRVRFPLGSQFVSWCRQLN
ncbi:hypothetical protein RA27_21145 [Ruegeria sp. ANG-R]|uniref:RNA-directed DNA polymerase n=1 Tax=Ruegeria sp. ANG-R TaxID=1577903 RepID=UPI00057D8111|nr:RNA-directed DNA polymerase [Ruegeria sp. ANG-R]KIC37658.1 hypothetical protein RA27_21145 [Ruegeria sp. ANG-R]